MDSTLTFLDVEASGLDPSSYPIQVGWVDSSGDSDEFLINPETTLGWLHWNEYAEKEIHKISRDKCIAQGLHVHDAAIRLNSQLAGISVISDAVGHDEKWIDKLFHASGVIRKFELIDVRDVIFSLRESPNEFFNERRARKASHQAVDDCVRNLQSGAACGFWPLNTAFTNQFGEIQIMAT